MYINSSFIILLRFSSSLSLSLPHSFILDTSSHDLHPNIQIFTGDLGLGTTVINNEEEGEKERYKMGKMYWSTTSSTQIRQVSVILLPCTEHYQKKNLYIIFDGKDDEPEGNGLLSEWYPIIAKEMSLETQPHMPDPASYVNPDHLKYFKFVGCVVVLRP